MSKWKEKSPTWIRPGSLFLFLAACSLVNNPSDFQNGDEVSDSSVADADVADVADAAADAAADAEPMDIAEDIAADTADPGDAALRDAGGDAPDGGPEPLSIVQIDAGDAHACVLLANHRVICWGDNDVGQTGHDGTSPDYITAAKLEFVHIALAGNISCGITTGAQAICWGDVESSAQADSTFVRVDGRNRVTVLGVGADPTGVDICIDNDEGTFCARNNRLHMSTDASGVFPGGWGGSAPTQLALGINHLIALRPTGVTSHGTDGNGQRGDGEDDDYVVDLDGVTQIAASWNRACATSANRLWCWGRRDYLAESEANRLEPDPILTDTSFSDLDINPSMGCAATNEGVYCWGQYPSYASGMRRTERTFPEKLDDAPTRLIATGGNAVAANGFACTVEGLTNVSCWGSNSENQLGAPTGEFGRVEDILESLFTSD